MNCRKAAAIAALVLVAASSQVNAALVISSEATHGVTCSGGTCKATAQSAVLNVSTVKSLLAAGPVSLQSTNIALDVVINADIAWPQKYGLLLDGYRSVVINRPIVSEGGGTIYVQTNNGGSGGVYGYGTDGSISCWDLHTLVYINAVKFTLVNSVPGLAAAIHSNPAGNYAFSNAYDASQDGVYSKAPIQTVFTGKLEGLGNVISNLSIDDPTPHDYVGLFVEIGKQSLIRNLRLYALNVTGADLGYPGYGAIGGIAAKSDNSGVERSSVHGHIKGGSGGPVGGLIGQNFGTHIDHSHFVGTVSGGAESFVGGMIGELNGGIYNSTVVGTISGGDGGTVGGLIGYAEGAYSSTFTGTVRVGNATAFSSALAGGIVGYGGYIRSCRSKGHIIVGNDAAAGGIVGVSDDEIVDSSSSATISGGNRSLVGGFAGSLGGPTSFSYATGSVTGKKGSTVGGFTGHNSGQLSNIYSFGAASGGKGSTVGGFIGVYTGTLDKSYSIGAVSGEKVGGFAGYSGSGFDDDYWDVTTSGTDTGVGEAHGGDSRPIGLTDTQLKAALPSGFDPKIWGQSPNINGGYPYLLANPPQ